MCKMIAFSVFAVLFFVTPFRLSAAETAPHGGILLEMGEEQGHLELIHDPKSGKLSIYVLDGKARNSVMIKDAPKVELKTASEAKQIILKATDSKDGKASQFEASDDALKTPTLKGKIVLIYKEKPYELDMEKVDEK